MKTFAIRLIGWGAVLLPIAFVGFFGWLISADKRGRWLREAACRDEMDKVKLLVWLGTDVNYRTGDGSAMHGAAANGNIEMMTFLIERGASVDLPAKFGVTPLWYAREHKWTEAEDFLISRGANPDTSHIHLP